MAIQFCLNAFTSYSILFALENYLRFFYSRMLRQPFGSGTIANINSHDFVLLGGGDLFLSDTVSDSRSGWQCLLSNLERISKSLVLFVIGNNRFIGQIDFNDRFIEHLNNTVEKSVFVGLGNNGSIKTIRDY